MSQIVFLSSQPGAGLKAVEKAVEQRAKELETPVRFFHLDDVLVEKIYELYPRDEPVRRQELYRLPEPCILRSAEAACEELREFVGKCGSDIVMVLMHCIYANPEKRTYFCPFSAVKLSNALEGRMASFITLQQDIYETRSNLWNSYYVRESLDWRNPVKDYDELRDVLSWRAFELVGAKMLSCSLGARFFLLHMKAPVDVLWKIAVLDEPSVYLSHSISDARRHWTGVRDASTPKPEQQVGDEFARELNRFAAQLRKYFAVVEPTCVDELRIQPLASEIQLDKLGSHLLPSLSKRWPIYDDDRLSYTNSEDTGNGMYRVDPTTLAGRMEVNPTSEAAPVGIKRAFESMGDDLMHAQRNLEYEINRQITIRDFQLTDQSEVVVVYRPYQNSLVPRISRGVIQEYKAKLKAADELSGQRSKVILIHPFEDEQRRRALVFDGYGSEEFGNATAGVFDVLWQKSMEGICPPVLKDELRRFLIGHPMCDKNNPPTKIDAIKVIFDMLTQSTLVHPKVGGAGGGLSGMPNVGVEDGIRRLARELVDAVLFSDQILIGAFVDGTTIFVYANKEVDEQLIQMIRA